MNTRRTGKGWKDPAVRCTCTARSIRARGVNATCPSTPAVARPALRCVTCRTLSSVFDQLRSIIFCRFLTRARSCAFDALKILPRSRRTCSSCTGHTIVSQSRGLSSGPFAPRAAIALSKAKAVIASNLPFGSGGSGAFSFKRLTRHKSACFRSRAPGPVSGQLYGTRRREGSTTNGSAFLLLFGYRHSLLGRPVPAKGFRLPYGRPTTTAKCDGPDGVATFHTFEIRPGRVPALPREQRCPRDHRIMLSRRLPILNGPLLIIPTSTTRLGELP
jgi:hypothetical protein